MGVIGIILLVVFIIVCVLLVGIILLQKDEGGGLGGLFGGGASAFGSRSQTVVTKTTYVFVTLFFLTTFGLALLNKTSNVESLSESAAQIEQVDTTEMQSWLDEAVEETEGDN